MPTIQITSPSYINKSFEGQVFEVLHSLSGGAAAVKNPNPNAPKPLIVFRRCEFTRL